jgi:hypothetical protein
MGLPVLPTPLNYVHYSSKEDGEDEYRTDGTHRDPAYIYSLDWFQPESWAIDSQFFGTLVGLNRVESLYVTCLYQVIGPDSSIILVSQIFKSIRYPGIRSLM